MSRWIEATLILVAGGAGWVGCSSKAASPKKGTQPQTTPAPKPTREPEHPAKPATRELAFSTYSNPEYGVSFHYPRNFALEEGVATEEREGIRSQEELESEEPGGV